MQDWKYYSKGYVRIRVCAPSPERFLNLCSYHKIQVWNLVYREQAYEMNVTIAGFYRLKGICRKTHSRIKILGKYGLPFVFLPKPKKKGIFCRLFPWFPSPLSAFQTYLEYSCGGKCS